MTNPKEALEEMIRPELLPCPFCGQKDGYMGDGDRLLATMTNGRCYTTFCTKCEADGPPGSTKSEAKNLWNKRS